MDIKRILSIFMCIAVVFTAIPFAAYAQDEVQPEEEKQTVKLIDFEALKEKAEDAFEGAGFFGYWGAYFGLAGVLGILALPISPILVAYHQISKAVSEKKNAAS